MRVAVYEGAISAQIFYKGEVPVKQTTCRSLLTCCRNTPVNVFLVGAPDKGGNDESGVEMVTPEMKDEAKRRGLGTSPMAHENGSTGLP